MDEIDRRSLFVSHAHADRTLAAALSKFIGVAFSGLVDSFVSSSPTPGQGISAGDEWYGRIQRELQGAERVWVLATPTSVTHPWIFFEAGVGRALCAGGVTPLCVGVAPDELPSPLDQFQSYDGLDAGERGLRALAVDVGAQLGMKIPEEFLGGAIEDWLSAAGAHTPDEAVPNDATVAPEQLDRMDALLSRLERLPVLQPVSPTLTDRVDPRPNDHSISISALVRSLAASGMAPETAARLLRLSSGDYLQQSLFEPPAVPGPRDYDQRLRLLGARAIPEVNSQDALISIVEDAPPETKFEAIPLTAPGEVRVRISDDVGGYNLRLRGPWLQTLDTVGLPARSAELVRAIRQTLGLDA